MLLPPPPPPKVKAASGGAVAAPVLTAAALLVPKAKGATGTAADDTGVGAAGEEPLPNPLTGVVPPKVGLLLWPKIKPEVGAESAGLPALAALLPKVKPPLEEGEVAVLPKLKPATTELEFLKNLWGLGTE